ncbi:heavy-metal-associated domain-containing protein [Magnetococcus sp. PR-3]|uniref:heavy-metal-associated domain-containing protein n=1 Tax=Magnetococcus sp. PR-3 TaxID=3120355 RepID=UPI002FCE2B19
MSTAHKTHPVTRRIRVFDMVCPECEKIIAEGLLVLDGVIEVESDWDKGEVCVTYDLFQVHVQDIEKLLIEIGYPLQDTFWAQTKQAWIHYTEKNEIDNLHHKAHCCSKPPAGA